MKTVGLITEYNPFHNGHKYHIDQAKAVTNADYVVVVMSGNYVQRGAPAIINKNTRAEAALACGADLVIELPVQYATGSANYFAAGAISLLDQLGIIDYICFGSECGDINTLKTIADLLENESEIFKTTLAANIKIGLSYPTARNHAITAHLKNVGTSVENLQIILSSPNNLLAIEYLKALASRKSSIKPYTITRNDSGYHSQNTDSPFVSASAIRNTIEHTANLSSIKHCIPEFTYRLLDSNFKKNFPITTDDFSLLLGNALLQADISNIFDINRDLAYRIIGSKENFTSFTSFANHLKTKNITLTAIYRSLLHILLNIKQNDIQSYIQNDWIEYIRIIGFKKSASTLLTEIKANSNLTIISKLSNYKEILVDKPLALRMLEQNIYADHLYRLVTMNKYNSILPNEYQTSILIK